MMFRVVFWVNPEDNSEHHTRRRENLKSHIRLTNCMSLPFACIGSASCWIRVKAERSTASATKLALIALTTFFSYLTHLFMSMR
jgi:hypothetical protein